MSEDDKKSRRARADTTLGANAISVHRNNPAAQRPECASHSHSMVNNANIKPSGSYPTLTKRTTDQCKCVLTDLTTKFPISCTNSPDFHTSFTTCVTCQRRGPEYLCLQCGKAMCIDHVKNHYVANNVHRLFLFSELVRYEEAFFCYKCESFLVIEAFDTFLDTMFVTKGSFVDDPVTHKHTDMYERDGRVVAAATMQGWRSANEDAHCVYLGMPHFPDLDYFGVFDGHGGPLVSRYAATRLIEIFEGELSRKNNGAMTRCADALIASFQECDAKMHTDGILSVTEIGSCGSTANVVILDRRNKTIHCANAGDARAVLCRGAKAVPLSVDHRPSNPGERRRILASGSQVHDDRVDGMLAVSRALGDFDFKQASSLAVHQQAVTCIPEVSVNKLLPEDHFMILACDGIWDVMTSQQVVDFIRVQLQKSVSPTRALEALLDRCVAKDVALDGLGTDNMSVVLVLLSEREQP